MNLKDYINKLLDQPFGKLVPPILNGLSSGGGEGAKDKVGLLGVVIDRSGQFQTELFIVSKHLKFIECHTHPNVDSFELNLSGLFVFERDGKKFVESKSEELDKKTILEVPHDCAHGGWFPHGGAFLSFQKWMDGVEPTTVGENFDVIPGERIRKAVEGL